MKEVASHTQGEYELVDVGGMSPKGDTDLSYQLVGREYICDLIFGTFRKEQKRELELAEANAAFIVRACNSHAELLAALEACVKHFKTGNRAVCLVPQSPHGSGRSRDPESQAMSES